MVLVYTIAELHQALSPLQASGKKVGFVPTMGALHAGHISLVDESIKNNDVTVVSIFVNPTQFNDRTDFEKYPRNVERDAELLGEAGAGIVFVPSEKEIYPEPDNRVFDFTPIDKPMEGKHRPGHFNGVAQVVSRLFEIVKPDRAYFGEKDFQQLAIIRAMVEELDLPVHIIGMPIMREKNGLAMSSRNERLTAEQREIASVIYKALKESSLHMMEWTVSEAIEKTIFTINKEKDLKVEYFEIVEGTTLQPVSDWKDAGYIVGCIAVYCGEVRLIDNITYSCQLT